MAKVSIQMDPIKDIDIYSDTTFALAMEGIRRGHELFYYETRNLTLYKGILEAKGHSIIELKKELGNHISLGKMEKRKLKDEEIILMRQDPPFDMNYITYTHFLEDIHPKTLVVNNPSEVRNAPEKLFVNKFKEFIPETLISRNYDDIYNFRKEYKDIIIKPLYGNGGKQIFHIDPNNQNFSSLLEMFFEKSNEPIIIQRYLPEVKKGDCRVVLIDGKIGGAINRVPLSGEVRSNLHVGGKPEKKKLNNRELLICEALENELKSRGLILVGIDIIGGYLTEINVTSPTGVQEISKFENINLSSRIWETIESKL